MNVSFQVPAILTRVSATADRGLSLGFRTNELSADEKTKILDAHQRFGWLLFKQNEFTSTDIPDEDAPEDGDKKPSARLRAVLYVLSQQQGATDFDQFYRQRMEAIIEAVKKKLEPKV